jgi:hypothetical protein
MREYLEMKTTEMSGMFRGIQSDVDLHLKDLIGKFLA